jgi:small-conductance mechanosensitive channel
MKQYPLEPIRQLRERRHEDAERELIAARQVEEARRKALQEAQQKLKDYLQWLEKESDRLFKSVLGSVSPLYRINQVTEEIKWHRAQQEGYEKAIEEAKKQLQEAKDRSEECLAAREKAYKELWKLNQHRDIWREEEQEKEEKEEEANLEEIAGVLNFYK